MRAWGAKPDGVLLIADGIEIDRGLQAVPARSGAGSASLGRLEGRTSPLDPDRVDLSPLAVAVGAARISADKSSLIVAGVRAETGLALAIARLARTSVRFFGAHCRPAMNEGRLRARGHG